MSDCNLLTDPVSTTFGEFPKVSLPSQKALKADRESLKDFLNLYTAGEL